MPIHRIIRRGDLFWLSVPREGASDIVHPHVVIQDDLFNRSRIETVVVCALTTNRRRANEPGNVLLELDEAGLLKQSVVVVSQVSSVPVAELGERIGSLGHDRVEQILAGLRFQQNSGFVR